MKRILLLVLILGAPLSGMASELFPRPPELEADVQFWIRVYTEIDTRSGFIHDATDPHIVYETLRFGDAGRKTRANKVKAAKERYERILQRLAAGGHDRLDADEQRVLALWPEGTTPSRLRQAADELRFQMGQADKFRAGLVRSGAWEPHIRGTLAELGLPSELAALPHVESSFNPAAYSKVGAAGLWQFIRSTGRRYMRIDHVVDERLDPHASTIAAAQLLQYNYSLVGSWPLAITAYNHGLAGMHQAVRKMGTTDINTILREYRGRAFGFASRNFYLSFLAALEIDQNPEKYFGPIQRAPETTYDTVALSGYLSVDTLSKSLNVSKDTLRTYNPALRPAVWTGTKLVPKGYNLQLPSSTLNAPLKQLLASIPPTDWQDSQTPDLFHTVARGDTLSGIAAYYGTNVRELMALNQLDNKHWIRAGQRMRLPAAGPLPDLIEKKQVQTVALAESVIVDATERVASDATTVAEVTDGMTEAENAGQPPATDPSLAESDSEAVNPADIAGDPSDYSVAPDQSIEVQALETLGHYAEWLDIRASDLRRLNNMPFGKSVILGHRLKLDFARVQPEVFEQRRAAYHREIQQQFFATHRITDTLDHVIRKGESVWDLSQRNQGVPFWLLRQYNIDLDFANLRPGMVLVIPKLAVIDAQPTAQAPSFTATETGNSDENATIARVP